MKVIKNEDKKINNLINTSISNDNIQNDKSENVLNENKIHSNNYDNDHDMLNGSQNDTNNSDITEENSQKTLIITKKLSKNQSKNI